MPLLSKKSSSIQQQSKLLSIKEIIHNWIADTRSEVKLISVLLMEWKRPIFKTEEEKVDQKTLIFKQRKNINKKQLELEGDELKFVEWIAFHINASDERINRTLLELGVMKQRTKNILDKIDCST